MNFDGFQPVAIERFSSLVEQADATSLPSGVATEARNVRFSLTSVRTRDGIQSKYGFILPSGEPVTGLAGLKVGGNPDTYVPMAFDSAGNVYIESPAGSGKTVAVASNLVSPPLGASMQAAAAFKRGFLAFSDLKNSKGAGAVYDIASGRLDPLSLRPMGDPWKAGTFYNVGEVVTPSTPFGGNGHTYRCTVAGTSANAQPAFPTTEGGTVVEAGGPTWQEDTPQMVQALPEPAVPTVARNAGAGTFAAGRDVYIIVTLVNGNGETDGQTTLAYKAINTTLNDQYAVTSPTLAPWVQALAAPYAVTGYNVYEADVATGGAAPLISAYKKVNGAVVPIGTNTNVNTSGAGAAPQTTNGATVVPLGNICSGLRYAIVLFLSRNGYISGVSAAAVVSYNSPTAGYQLYMPYIPTGPANTQARIVAFTPAGDLSTLAGNGISSGGPYFWIPPSGFTQVDFDITKIAGGITVADIANGISMTSTVVNDNTTTSGTFNFTDDYLKDGENDLSACFRKIQIPDLVDVFYSETMRRMFYRVDSLPSGWYVSAKGDPETVYGDAGFVQVAENNGENAITAREYGGVVYLLKERSGHALSEDATDPAQWKPVKQWGGSGPSGPRAVDTCTTFLCYVHRSGVYIYKGGAEPFRISKEIPITWSKINWKYQHLIWVQIDDEYQEIRIGVPYAGSTTPNLILKCNYEESPNFEPPIHFSPYIGKEIATGACYKWSVDDVPANLALRIERPLTNPPAFIDPATAQSQLLYASANPDGAVSAIIPNLLNDNGVGIDSVYETAAPEQLLKVNQLGGVQVNNNGVGETLVEVLSLRAKDPKDGGVVPAPGQPQANAGAVIPMKKPCIGGIPYSCGASGQNERFRMRFSNGKRADVGFDIKWAAIMARPISSARPSR